jgi:hypothetical protein
MNFKSNQHEKRENWIPEQRSPTLEVCSQELEGSGAVEYPMFLRRPLTPQDCGQESEGRDAVEYEMFLKRSLTPEGCVQESKGKDAAEYEMFPEQSLSPEGCCPESKERDAVEYEMLPEQSLTPEGRDAVEYEMLLLVDAKAQPPPPPLPLPPPSFIRRGRSALSRKKAPAQGIAQVQDDLLQVEENVQGSKSFHVMARSRSSVAQVSHTIKDLVRSLSPEPPHKKTQPHDEPLDTVKVSHIIKESVRSLSPEPLCKDKKTKRHSIKAQIPRFFRGRTKTRNSKAPLPEDEEIPVQFPVVEKVLVISAADDLGLEMMVTVQSVDENDPKEYSQITRETQSPPPTARPMENTTTISRENAPVDPSNIENGNLNEPSKPYASMDAENDLQQNKRIAGRLEVLELDAEVLLELAKIRTRLRSLPPRYFTFVDDSSQSTQQEHGVTKIPITTKATNIWDDRSMVSTLTSIPQRLECDQRDILGSCGGETHRAIESALSSIMSIASYARPQLQSPNTRTHDINKHIELWSTLNVLDTVDDYAKSKAKVPRKRAQDRLKLSEPLQRHPSCRALKIVGEKHHRTLTVKRPVFKQSEAKTSRIENHDERRLLLKHMEEKAPKVEKVPEYADGLKIDNKSLVRTECASEGHKTRGASELQTCTIVHDSIAKSTAAASNSHAFVDESSCPSQSSHKYKGSLGEMAKSFQQNIKLNATGETTRSSMESLAATSKEDCGHSVETGNQDDHTPVGASSQEDRNDSVDTGENKSGEESYVCTEKSEDMDSMDTGAMMDAILAVATPDTEDYSTSSTLQIVPRDIDELSVIMPPRLVAALEEESKCIMSPRLAAVLEDESNTSWRLELWVDSIGLGR